MKKMSDKQMFDYILYIKKYKPEIWLDLQGNKKVQKLMKKFESVDESFGLILRNLAKHAAKKAMYDKMKKNRKKGRRESISVNEGVVDKIDELSDVIRKEIFSIGKKDKKMGLELAKLYKKYFIEFFVRVKKMTKDSSLIETKKRDSRGTLRDYKKEYKKYGSSTKSKKYRAELNKYNRQQGTYGNGDGKDASHKGGKIVGFESQSKNRGRAEKSRLKK